MTYQEDMMTKLLSSYRVIPDMYRVLHSVGAVANRAEEDLSKILLQVGHTVPFNKVHAFISPYKNWIDYAMADFTHYIDLVGPIPPRDSRYWPRMREEAALVTNTTPFATGIEHVTILDIGAGCIPYLPYFKKENKEIERYVASDKRYTSETTLDGHGIPLGYLEGDYKSVFAAGKMQANVLFLGNFLHCLSDIEEFFDLVRPKLVKLKMIKILEPKPGSNLDFLFDYHMFEHCGGHRFDFLDLDDLFPGKCKKVESLGAYHEMYTIEL